MYNLKDRKNRFALMHSSVRINSNKSQEFMAESLNVTKKTIQNWENGKSSPSFFQSLEWFRALCINPFPHYFKLVNPDNHNNSTYKSEEDINKAFDNLCDNLPTSIKRALLYIFLGNHGSSPTAIVQLALAYLHLPLKTRSSHTSTVIHDYEIEESMGNLINNNELPDMTVLINAFECANKSILKKLEQYNDIN